MPNQFYYKQQVVFEREGKKVRGVIVQYFERDDTFRVNTNRGDSFLIRQEKILAEYSN